MAIKKLILIITLCLFLLIAGCSSSTSTSDDQNALKKNVETKEQQIETTQEQEVQKQQDQETSQDLVNFKCTISGVQTFYFLKDKAKIESKPDRESWLLDDGYYMKMDIDGELYLVKYPPEEAEMSFDSMIQTYKASKNVDGMDCELNTVDEAMMTLPDLEILSKSEYEQKILEIYTSQGTSVEVK